jgi:hypothetical protein
MSDESETKNESKVEETNGLDEAIKNLLTICNEVQDSQVRAKAGQPNWAVCCNRFKSSYDKVGDCEGFRECFIDFHTVNSEKYSVKIFEDEDVNDTFFSDTTPSEVPGGTQKKAKKKKSWAKKPVNKGPVIYFSDSPKASGVCIPIGEVYRSSVRMYEDMEKSDGDDAETRALPARILHAFYSVILFANGDFCNGNAVIKENIKILEEAISDVTSGEPKKSTEDGPFGILSDIVSKLTSGANPTIPGGSNVGDMLDSFTKGDGAESVQKVFTTVMESVNKEGIEKEGIGGVLKGISEGLAAPETADAFENIQSKISGLTTGSMAPPTVSTPEDNVGADEQE